MARLFLVFGTAGAGKSTVLSGIRSAKTVTIGSEMRRVYASRFGVRDRDLIRKKSLTVYDEMVIIRNAILKRLSGTPGTIIIDTHASVKTGNSYLMGLSMRDFDVLRGKVKAIIYVDAETKQIMARRKSDKTRKRENDTVEELDMWRNINLICTMLYSLYLQVPVHTVQNPDGGLSAARKQVNEIIKGTK